MAEDEYMDEPEVEEEAQTEDDEALDDAADAEEDDEEQATEDDDEGDQVLSGCSGNSRPATPARKPSLIGRCSLVLTQSLMQEDDVPETKRAIAEREKERLRLIAKQKKERLDALKKQGEETDEKSMVGGGLSTMIGTYQPPTLCWFPSVHRRTGTATGSTSFSSRPRSSSTLPLPQPRRTRRNREELWEGCIPHDWVRSGKGSYPLASDPSLTPWSAVA